ncbi:hypothetical protein IJG27_01385 [Candidatus Saccharibacteria bacterium]|nr:hypothetical protein [Candidatus Saccharibacteria bacterium]
MKVLITNPEVDAFTRYLHCWTKQLIKNLRNNVEVFHLEEGKANRIRFEGMLKKNVVDVVLLNGHGDYDFVLGDYEKILDKENVALLKGKTVHAMSCSSAKELGVLAVQSGAKAYLGYDEPFLAPRMKDKVSNPLKDGTAKLFLDPAFITQKALLNGKAPGEAVELAHKEYDRSIVKALRSPIQSDNDKFVGLLLWDKEHLVAVE